MSDSSSQTLLIIDFGSQVTQLIARRVREANVYAEIHPFQNVTPEFLADLNPRAVILSGGPASVLDPDAPHPSREIFNLNIPLLGICYGQQIMTKMLGGKVQKTSISAEFGSAFVSKTADLNLLEGWFDDETEKVWMSHGDHVAEIAPGFSVFGVSPNAPFAITADLERKFYAVQFHPEVYHTPKGARLLQNFLKIAGFDHSWTMDEFRTKMLQKIRNQVGSSNVICALSGGVDSAVTTVLLHEAIGKQLTCVFVDNGLLRENEAHEIVKMFRSHYNINLVHVKAENKFLQALSGIRDPEQKRKIIGKNFIDIFEEEANKIDNVKFLGQGTLYPDVIESVSFSGGPSATIKSHHNVGGLPEKMHLSLIEPLRKLFKDEVRKLGKTLNLPPAFIARHPFPGPGLAIRCPGEVRVEKLAILRRADRIYIDQIRKYGLYDEIWQAFVVLLPVKSVGVMGDGRSYDYACILRAVTSTDGMTADYYPFSHAFLGETATRIVNEVTGINRVSYDITSKPPGTIEWE